MAENRVTKNDVIKALQCCIKSTSDCDNCPLHIRGDGDCTDKAKQGALDIINQQRTEIERLKEELEIRNQKRVSIFEISNAYERGRANAIKEFAETYTENFIRILNLNCEQIEVARKVKDNLKSALLGICDDITEKGVSNND